MAQQGSGSGLNVEAEEKELRAVERRRQAEKERRERIFNVKRRTVGVDVAALDQQVREKREREERDRQREISFDQYEEEVERQLQRMQQDHEMKKREIAKEIDQYRKECQLKDGTREWDLNNPVTMKNTAALSPDNMPTSSIQNFDGEDLAAKERKKAQQEQLRCWIEQQKQEKQRAQQTEDELERLHALRQHEITERTKELDRLQQETKRAMNMADRDYNKAMADAKSETDKEDLIAHTLQGLDEIQATMQSDFMREDPAAAVSYADSSRVIPQQFKGMSPQQRASIVEQQRTQAAAKEEARRRDAEEKRRWEQQEIAIMRATLLRQREMERQRREMARQTLQDNRGMSAEQRQKLQQTDELFANKISPGFFEQFGTSTR
eukprot:TRINITY_DN3510_c0_g1_i1.p1 TRINITY_DN3510_c0_g1~~TRINITY_DN3510_c0_g1_i1.p1  ORF type:complete len:389 (-),score=166.96 TRINITY_DN3510_c0_g1_i1:67-1209(-)